MTRTMLKSKIHRATVTEANVEYEGSVSIDAELMAWADRFPGSVWISGTAPMEAGSRPM